ncbi:MAG TPA: hypothetical protein P5026_09950 [Kiritimatiellia bacterium]|nr:hypothetical protein [Kiritimatiellia bacterium]HRR34411.1 hypothetical protein [Kiritimatiellia bacterium]
MRKQLLFFAAITCLASFFLHEGGCSKRDLPNAELTVVHLSDLHLPTRGQVTDTPWTHKIVDGKVWTSVVCLNEVEDE